MVKHAFASESPPFDPQGRRKKKRGEDKGKRKTDGTKREQRGAMTESLQAVRKREDRPERGAGTGSFA